MTFKRIWLQSLEERRALRMDFHPSVTVLQGGNGYGKSALLKSLYDTFGAEPHRIDQSWRSANVISAIDFEVAGQPRTILKFSGAYVVFDEDGRKIFQTNSVTQELAPFIAELLDFRLLMTDQRENVLVPPPAYAFAPFYLDQDKSWTSAWEPFRSMYLPRSAATLADYHSGLKPNEYYLAQAEKDRLAVDFRKAEVRLQGLQDAVEQLRSVEPETAVYFSLEDFEAETSRLLAESARLLAEQTNKRVKLSELVEARALWLSQMQITRAALSEVDEVFRSAAGHPIEVECPTCGEHYKNDIATRFAIAADVETLTAALRHAQKEKDALDGEIDAVRADIAEMEAAASRVQAILSTRKNDVTLGEVVAAEGRNAATRVLRDRAVENEHELGRINVRMEEMAAAMKKSIDRRRSRAIKAFFADHFSIFAHELDVRLGKSTSITATNLARGSEGPRGLAAYSYAFLHTAREFGSSAFCPLVIDAPNQQGQDAEHLPAIISFLVGRRPPGAQLILGVEEALGISDNQTHIVNVGVRRNQLLRDEQFEPVSKHLRPYLAQLTG